MWYFKVGEIEKDNWNLYDNKKLWWVVFLVEYICKVILVSLGKNKYLFLKDKNVLGKVVVIVCI